MELMLPDYECVTFPPSQRAAASLCLAMKITDNSKWVRILVLHYFKGSRICWLAMKTYHLTTETITSLAFVLCYRSKQHSIHTTDNDPKTYSVIHISYAIKSHLNQTFLSVGCYYGILQSLH